MASPPLLTLSDIRLTFGGGPLFERVDLVINKGERIALIGRNGAGKSTLMKIVASRFEADEGKVWIQPGCQVVYAEQEPNLEEFDTLLAYASEGMDDIYRAESELTELGVSPDADPKKQSGGQLRRAALARAFAADPDILLLDEPTNHLDVEMIEMLETRLKAFRGAVLVVSHDRRFLETVSTNMLWLRQGKVRKSSRGYTHFDTWAEEVEAEEETALKRMKTQLKAEARWLSRGVTGRRKRNQGRLTRLHELRAEHARRRSEHHQSRATADLSVEVGTGGSRKVIEARGLSKTFSTQKGPLRIVEDFTIRILRGDRIGIIGPNGVGKTSLVKLLLKQLEPDNGSVKLAKTLEMVFLDQTRESLKPKDTLWETLAPEGGDAIMVQGHSRHVVSYAKDFLFDAGQMRQPVSALSGGERNRLTLAVALAKPSNLLVLDEPTNDLDMQTLDLLEDMLSEYQGTLILISHDRAFLDNTVTSCLSPVGDGQWLQTAGGWSDAEAQLRPSSDPIAAIRKPKSKTTSTPKSKTKLSFKDSHRLKELDTLMPALTEEIRSLEAKLADPDLYASDTSTFAKLSDQLASTRIELENAEEDWLELEDKREALRR